MEQENQTPNQQTVKPVSNRWKWVILILAVADFWGILFFPSIPFGMSPSGPDPGYYEALKNATALCGEDTQLVLVMVKGHEEVYSFSGGSSGACAGDAAADVTYNEIFGVVTNAEILAKHASGFKPIPISAWKISSKEALTIALANGGQAYLDAHPTAKTEEVFLDVIDNMLIWSGAFIQQPAGHGARYVRLNATTGEVPDQNIFNIGE